MSYIVAIIPARWASARFPGKSLHMFSGKPMLQHVWDRCCRCTQIDDVYVATDDERIFQAAKHFGAKAFRTSHKHLTGTDRVAEVVAHLPNVTHVVNVQCDEPTLDPQLLCRITKALHHSQQLEMVTAAAPFPTFANPSDPHMVKVIVNRQGYAVYFSRLAIPFSHIGDSTSCRLLHIGVYGFKKSFLLKFASWKPSPLEECEKLEQLRALENGTQIQVLLTTQHTASVDTPEDAKSAASILQKQQQNDLLSIKLNQKSEESSYSQKK